MFISISFLLVLELGSFDFSPKTEAKYNHVIRRVCLCVCVPLSSALGVSSAQDFSVLSLTSFGFSFALNIARLKLGCAGVVKFPCPVSAVVKPPQNAQAVLMSVPLGLSWEMVLLGLMPTFSRSRASTFLPVPVRATPHSRGVKHSPQLAGAAAVKCMVSGYRMKWKCALLGSCIACFGVMLYLKCQDTLAGGDTWVYFTELHTLPPPLCPASISVPG